MYFLLTHKIVSNWVIPVHTLLCHYFNFRMHFYILDIIHIFTQTSGVSSKSATMTTWVTDYLSMADFINSQAYEGPHNPELMKLLIILSIKAPHNLSSTRTPISSLP